MMKGSNVTEKDVKVTDIITVFWTTILVIATLYYAFITKNILESMNRQVVLTQSPIIKISPEDQVIGQLGDFTLTIINTGISDVIDIDIYWDPFLSLQPNGEPVRFYRFGMVTAKANHKISTLRSGQKQEFKVEFKDNMKEINEFYIRSDMKGMRMRILRLIINFKREVDRKEFSFTKAYVIGGKGEVLSDHYDPRRDFAHEEGYLSYPELKRLLGVYP